MNIQRVAVVGAGTMGNGIAHVFAQHGFEVTLVDIKDEFLQKAINTIKTNLERQVKKGVIDESVVKETLDRIRPTVRLSDAASAQLAIEAVNEELETKRKVLEELDRICPPTTIIASNTSSLPITALANFTKRPEKVIGMHFMNPVPVMKLVELVKGMMTTEETFQTVKQICLKLDKTPVLVHDYPGFVSNRVLMPMINEAVFCLMEGVASAEDIDTVMKLGMNHPLGPLALADLIGLDVCLAIMEVLYQGYADSKYRPCPLLRKMVQAGYLGRKTGRGFYSYESKN